MRIAKICIAVFLALNTLGSTLLVPLIYIDYSLRKDYIAEVLCINQDEPMTICNGQCFLQDQLNKNVNHESEEKTHSNKRNQLQLFKLKSAEIQPLLPTILVSKIIGSQYSGGFYSAYVCDIFHPPQLV